MMQLSKSRRFCVFVLQCLRFRVLKLCDMLYELELELSKQRPSLSNTACRYAAKTCDPCRFRLGSSRHAIRKRLRGGLERESRRRSDVRHVQVRRIQACTHPLRIRDAYVLPGTKGSAEQMEHWRKKRMRPFWQTSSSHGPSGVGARRLATNPRCAATMRGNEGCLGLRPPTAPKRNYTRSP